MSDANQTLKLLVEWGVINADQAEKAQKTLVYTNTIPSYINTNVISAAFCLLVYSNAGGCLLLDNMAVAH